MRFEFVFSHEQIMTCMYFVFMFGLVHIYVLVHIAPPLDCMTSFRFIIVLDVVTDHRLRFKCLFAYFSHLVQWHSRRSVGVGEMESPSRA